MSSDERVAKGLELLSHLKERSLRHGGGAAVDDLGGALKLEVQDLQNLVVFLEQVGHIERVGGGMGEQPLYRVTQKGLRAVDFRGSQGPQPDQGAGSVTFHQTVHGTANTQVGSHNTMTVHVGAGVSVDDLLRMLEGLRGAVASLPEDEREEANETLDRAEQAVRAGAMDKLKRYGPALLDLGLKSVEFGTQAHAFLKLLGLV